MRAIHNDELTINGKLFRAKDLYTKKQMRTYGRWVRLKFSLGLGLMISNTGIAFGRVQTAESTGGRC
jgi:hypothetical protein